MPTDRTANPKKVKSTQNNHCSTKWSGGSDISTSSNTSPPFSMHADNQQSREPTTQEGSFYESSFDSSFTIELAIKSLASVFMSGSSVSES